MNEEHLSALAEVWSIELERIICRMLEISRNEVGPALPIEARLDAIVELAKLTLWLENKIIEKKIISTSIDQIDPDQERLALESTLVQERIENTARICADTIWIRLLNSWYQRFPLITSGEERQQPQARGQINLRRESPGVRDQHYSPVFSNKYWSVKPGNLIRIYWRGVDQHIKATDKGYKTWGKEVFLYSQDLEQLFSLIEGDARVPYTKLLGTVPLTEKERRSWIAFLIAQLFRTPSFLLQFLPRLKDMIKRRTIHFPTNTASLRRAYEELFTNNEVFARFYELITAHQWHLWSAPPSTQFVRSDNPVLIRGSAGQKTWQLIYPMTPHRCFVVGPDEAENPEPVVPASRKLDSAQLRVLNENIAKTARRSVIAMPVLDDSDLKLLLQNSLGRILSSSTWREITFEEFWGPIE